MKKTIFKLTHLIFDKDFLNFYNKFRLNEQKSYDELLFEQEEQLKNIIEYSYKFVPFYKKQFENLGIIPSDIDSINKLELLPVINKEIIKKNCNDFIPSNISKLKYYNSSTGGSTGVPFLYRKSKEQRLRSGILLYRGWGYADFELGDKVLFLGGSSLGISPKYSIVKKINEITRNIKKLSSFDMNDDELKYYVNIINSYKPKFIRGYASSIYFLGNWIKKKGLKVHTPKAVFTTSEKLYDNMREDISSAFNCDVFDGYGLADGGVTAYECKEHNGLHIDTECSVLEVVDENGQQISDGEGRIIATSLYNYAMPFIRYETGDIATISSKKCKCGRPYKLLPNIVGRSVDVLITPEGKNIHGWFFLYIFWKYCKGIKEYQVVQETINDINIKIVKEDGFDMNQLDMIKNVVKERSENWKINFEFVDAIERTKANKFKFIINNVIS